MSTRKAFWLTHLEADVFSDVRRAAMFAVGFWRKAGVSAVGYEPTRGRKGDQAANVRKV